MIKRQQAQGGSWAWGRGFAVVAIGMFAAGTVSAAQPSAPGLVFAAGNNNSGQLGIGAAWTPVQANIDHDELGNGTASQLPNVALVRSLTGVTAIAAGQAHSLALRLDGTVWAWGSNDSGALGTGSSNAYQAAPVQVPGLTDVTAVAAGSFYSFAIRSDGTLWAWGWNQRGYLGDGTAEDRYTPVHVSGLPRVIAIAAGDEHNLAVTSDGAVWVWGCNESCAAGDGNCSGYQYLPVQISSLSGVTGVAAGGYYCEEHSHALRSDGTVWSWGANRYAQLGMGYDAPSNARNTPTQLPGFGNVAALVAGTTHCLALKSDGTVWAWGNNWPWGQLGDGVMEPGRTPVKIPGLSGITAIAADRSHWEDGFSLAIKSDGTAWGWGCNVFGQLGLEGHGEEDHFTPMPIPGLAGVSAISAGGEHSLFLRVWPGDLNGDGDVDADDVADFRACLTGPGIVTELSPACRPADLDHDLDVDLSDFGLLQRCFSGPDVLADPDCAR